jgi:hypothetical protein
VADVAVVKQGVTLQEVYNLASIMIRRLTG